MQTAIVLTAWTGRPRDGQKIGHQESEEGRGSARKRISFRFLCHHHHHPCPLTLPLPFPPSPSPSHPTHWVRELRISGQTFVSPGDTQFWRTPEPLFYVIGYCFVKGTSTNRSRVRQSLGWRPSGNFCQS